MQTSLQITAIFFLGLSALPLAGCGSNGRERGTADRTEPPVEAYTVHIDSGSNGAAAPVAAPRNDASTASKRTLVFEAAGVGQFPNDGGPQEQWAAAREAAVLDAFAKAVIESRRSGGLPDEHFIEKISHRLTVAHRISDEGEEFEITLLDHGMERIFLIRDGALQHPPHDFELVRKIFAETGGEFALLPADDAPRDRYVARVGCYAVAGDTPVLAGEMREDDVKDAPDSATP
ncbi:MAG TPA: hypothetical protein VNT79_04150 [Phycisphaerae bacterium]|nr:hypothetical protein [Phycisphaerae bacterium]